MVNRTGFGSGRRSDLSGPVFKSWLNSLSIKQLKDSHQRGRYEDRHTNKSLSKVSIKK